MTDRPKLLLKLLKFCGLLGANLLLFPPLYLCAHFSAALPPTASLLFLAAAQGAGVLLFLIRGWTRGWRSPAGARLLRGGLIFLLGGLACFLARPAGGLLSGCFGISTAVCALQGSGLRVRDYDALARRGYLFWSLGDYLGGAFALWGLGRYYSFSYSLAPLTAAFFLFFLLYGLCSNQSNLDAMMERRDHQMERLPPKIRGYSICLTGLLLAAASLGFLLRRQLSALLWKLLELIKLLFIALIRLVVWLVSLLPDLSGAGEADPGPPPSLPPQEEGAGGVDWLQPVVLLLLLALCIWKRREIAAFFVRCWNRFSGFLRRLFTHVPLWMEKPGGGGEYRDQVERLEFTLQEPGKDAGGSRPGARRWRRDYRRFRRMPRSAERFRLGYRLIRDGLRLRGARVPDSETPLELYGRTSGLLEPESYARAVSGYDKARYSPFPADPEEFSGLERTLLELERTI